MSYSRVAKDLSNFLGAYHDASPFLEGPLCTETLIVSQALVDELATLGESVRLVWKEGSEYPGGVATALISVTRIGQSLVDQWVTGRTIRLDPADKERLGKALEWLKAADSPEDAPQGKGKPPAPPAIDFDALFDALLRDNRGTSAKLVRFMKDRTMATFQEVMDGAFGKDLEESTLRSYANRATKDLQGLDSRLWFDTKANYVVRHIDLA